jgi:hypothetical protein
VSGSWERHGLLAPAPTPQAWAASHAALPIADDAGEDGFVLLFSARDAAGRSHVARASVTGRLGSLAVSEYDEHPLLSPGELGTFDDAGVTTSCVVSEGSRRLLFYTGWSLGMSVPFHLFAGLAVSEDDGRTYARASAAPLLERSAVDPYLTASPCVLRDGGTWRMWYVAGTGWTHDEDRPGHRYHLRYAESDDGIAWRRQGHVCIDFAGPGEYAIGRPCVRKDRDRYRMWFCHRGPAYRLGYAESDDGLSWHRMDAAAGLDVSESGWDSEMIAYPWVFDHAGVRTMLYNGNGYGRTGIGWATLPTT